VILLPPIKEEGAGVMATSAKRQAEIPDVPTMVERDQRFQRAATGVVAPAGNAGADRRQAQQRINRP
jgi:tripartite-type tricarboxylate transporter receptor subunit TctC